MVLRRCTGKRTVQFLLSHLDLDELLLHSTTDSLHVDQFGHGKLSHSLSLVRPTDLAWRVSPNPNHAGKLQVRAEFKFGRISYSLVVTDPVWEAKCSHTGVGIHKHSELSTPGNDLVFLTVSLSAISFHGLHYKLVAGVIELPPRDSES